MKPESDSTGATGAQVHSTLWTLIMISAQSHAEGGKAALAELCRIYWYPLYSFARPRGYSPHDAQDLTQGFFLHLLERRALKRADPLKGKFRSFLLASFRNFLADEADRVRSIKRGGKHEFVFLDAEDAENRYQLEPSDHLTAEKIFDARWAMTLLTRAVERLREQFAACGETLRFEALSAFVGVAVGKAPPSYEEVAKSLGISIGAARTSIHRFRKQYAAFLRQEIGRTVSDPAEIDEEIHALCDALVVTEGRL